MCRAFLAAIGNLAVLWERESTSQARDHLPEANAAARAVFKGLSDDAACYCSPERSDDLVRWAVEKPSAVGATLGGNIAAYVNPSGQHDSSSVIIALIEERLPEALATRLDEDLKRDTPASSRAWMP